MKKANYFVYHQNPSGNHSFLNVGDSYEVDFALKIFAVADSPIRGLTSVNGQYPFDDRGVEAANLFTKGFVKYAREYIKKGEVGADTVRLILKKVNKDIGDFNKELGKDPHDLFNYDTVETVGFGAFIYNGSLYYGGVEDCYINVLRKGSLENIAPLEYQIMKSLKYANSLIEGDKFLDHLPEKVREKVNSDNHWETYWCTVLRNNPDIVDEAGKRVGWGSFNGDSRVESFVQSNVIKLEEGDIILLFSDGMIRILEEDSIVKWLIDSYEPTFTFADKFRKRELELFDGKEVLDKEKTLILWENL